MIEPPNTIVNAADTQRRMQFSTRTLLAAVAGCACIIGWVNGLARWTDEARIDVLAQLLAGFIYWSFVGSTGALVFGVLSGASLQRCLTVALLPGLPAGMVYATLLLTGVSDPGCFVAAVIVGLIAFASLVMRFSVTGRSDSRRPRQQVLLLLTLVVLATIGGNLWQLFAELPRAFERKITIHVTAYDAPPISIGAPVRRNGIEIGYVAEVRPTDKPEIRIIKLKLLPWESLYIGEVLAIPEPGREAPEGINVEFGNPGTYTGKPLTDGSAIHVIMQ